jgi:uncharacterized membrane protein YgcG
LKDELSTQFSGQANAGRPMLLEGGLRWQALSLSPSDMDFAGLKAAAAREIALAFGVPPMLLGLPGDATYANYREANKALWRQAILPLAAKILDSLGEGLRPWFADLSLRVDEDRVGALSEDRERLWAQISGADFLTLNEKRAMTGYQPFPENTPSPQVDEKNKTSILELKFNPWHDAQNGQFTHEGQGNRFASAGGGGGGGSGNEAKPKSGQGGFGGGRSGGGGATGSWDEREPKQPPTKPALPKREVVKPPPKAALPQTESAPKPKTREVTANGYHFELDAQNRTVRARGKLRLDDGQGRNTRRQLDEGKPDRLESDEGGHFIARRFGGPKEAINLFAQDRNFNRSDYARLENEWRRSLTSGKKVKIDIQAYYAGSSKRPDVIHVYYSVDGREEWKKFPNKTKRKIK